MDAVLKKLKLKKGEPRESEARQKLQKQLFKYTKCVDHGFPNKPSALAYDPKLRLSAIGSKTGAIRVYGAPGVEFSGQHEGDELAVSQIYFLPGQGRLITLCSDNSLHLWEIEDEVAEGQSANLNKVRSLGLETNKLKTITACCLTASGDQLYVGTEGGNIHVLNIYSFKLSDQIIYQDTVIQNVPDDFKVNPGAVESIQQHPTDPNKYLIGYNRGLIVLWDTKDNNALHTYNASQQLESIAWHSDGSQFMSAHADGSYIIWSSSDSTKPKEQGSTPYGPFACKAINKIQWKTAKADTFIIFSGGMPRASCGDRHTVSIMQGNQHVVFDFTSRVVDFVTLNSSEELSEIEKGKYDEPHTLLVLAEEELVAIDLENDSWPVFRAPYTCSLHSSAITCAQHVSNIPESLWTKIVDVGEAQVTSASTRDWPITGGKNLVTNGNSHDLLLTGHEDGSVRFWDASSTSMKLLYKMSTASIFGLEVAGDQTHNEDEDWPPFRKVGTFDPYSDDPRLGIQKIILCPLSESLVIGGTAGQVITMQFEREDREQEVKNSTVNIVDTSDGFVWKGHEALGVRGGDYKFPAGFQPVAVMQVQPPAAITALAMHSEWQLVAAGTAHGFAVYDYAQKKEVVSKCTLNPAELSGNTAASTPRRKSFKKSLRESFRRLRRRRSERKPKRIAEKTEESGKLEEQKPAEPKPEGDAPAAEGAEAATPATEAATAEPATPSKTTEPAAAETPKPVERQVEARDKTDDGMASMVRCLYFADTFLLNGQNHTPTLWAGTNAGTIFIYQITVPASDKRDADNVQCILAKEIQLQHRAPVIAVGVIDRNAQPLPGPLEVENERVKAADMTGGHHVVVASEEQFKIFSLPSLKANNKFKLTAHEGAKVRKVAFVNFRSKSDERYSENDLACLTNLGEIHIFTIPQLRRQMKQECVYRDNISGIASCVYTQNGEGFFLSSPSEFTRFSVSVRYATRPLCAITLGEDARPELEAVVEEVPEEPKVEETTAVAEDTTEQPPETTAAEPEAAAATEPSGDNAEPKEDGEKSADESALTLANQSVLSDDDIRVHLSEQSTLISSSQVTRTVVTRTVISERSTEDGKVTSETTTVQQSMSSSGDAGAASGGAEISAGGGESGGTGGGVVNSNLDDDTKLTTKQMSDFPGDEKLEELHISEEGDDETNKSTDVDKNQTDAASDVVESVAPPSVEISPSDAAISHSVDSASTVLETVTKSATVRQESTPEESPVNDCSSTCIVQTEVQEIAGGETKKTTTTTITQNPHKLIESTVTTITTNIAAGLDSSSGQVYQESTIIEDSAVDDRTVREEYAAENQPSVVADPEILVTTQAPIIESQPPVPDTEPPEEDPPVPESLAAVDVSHAQAELESLEKAETEESEKGCDGSEVVESGEFTGLSTIKQSAEPEIKPAEPESGLEFANIEQPVQSLVDTEQVLIPAEPAPEQQLEAAMETMETVVQSSEPVLDAAAESTDGHIKESELQPFEGKIGLEPEGVSDVLQDSVTEATQQTSEEVQPPTEEFHQPTEEVLQPNEEAQQPNEGVQQPTDEVQQPTDEVQQPTADVHQPTEEVQPPADEVQPPKEEVQPLMEEVQPPMEEVHQPTVEVQQPAEDVQAASEEVQQAAEPAESHEKLVDCANPTVEEPVQPEDEQAKDVEQFSEQDPEKGNKAPLPPLAAADTTEQPSQQPSNTMSTSEAQ